MSAAGVQGGLGGVVRTLGLINSIGSPGGPGLQALREAEALNNPAVRGRVGSSPFLAGLLGIGGSNRELVGPLRPGEGRPDIFQANLPPLDATTALNDDASRQLLAFRQTNPDLARVLLGAADPQQIGQAFGELSRATAGQAGNVVLRPGSQNPITIAAQPIFGIDTSAGRPLLVDAATGSVRSQLPATPEDREQAGLAADLQGLDVLLRRFGFAPPTALPPVLGANGAPQSPTAPTATPSPVPAPALAPRGAFSGRGVLEGDFNALVPDVTQRTTTSPDATTTLPAVRGGTTTTLPALGTPTTSSTLPGVTIDIDLPELGFPSSIQGTTRRPPIGPTPAVVGAADAQLATEAPQATPSLQALPGPAIPEIVAGPGGLTLDSFNVAVGSSSLRFTKPGATLADAQLLALDLFGTTDVTSLAPAQARELLQAVDAKAATEKARDKLLEGLTGAERDANRAWGSSAEAMDLLLEDFQRNKPLYQEFVGLGGFRAPLASAQETLGILSPGAIARRQLLARFKLAGFQWGGRALTGTEAGRVDVQVPLGTEKTVESFEARLANFAGQLAQAARTGLESGLQFRLSPAAQADMRDKITRYEDFFQTHFRNRLGLEQQF